MHSLVLTLTSTDLSKLEQLKDELIDKMEDLESADTGILDDVDYKFTTDGVEDD